MKINDAHFLITGGSSGIGRAIAELLLSKGANVAITGRDQIKLMAVAQQIGAQAIFADVSQPADVERTFSEFLAEHPQLDGLINNAGIGGHWVGISELDIDQMRAIYDVNVFGAAMMGQGAATIFKKQQYGNLVNVASTAALKGYPKGTAYASSKFALRGMTECWQQELRPFNVRVIGVNPSEVPTAFGQASREERPDEANKLHSEDIAHAIVGALEMDNRAYIPELTIHATNPFEVKPAPTPLEIIYQDEHLVAINKPHGLLVHKSAMANDATEWALQLLRDQLGRTVHPCHRIDRKTSGVLLFALSKDIEILMKLQFSERKLEKTYHCIVRGNTQDAGTIDYELTREDGKKQSAITHYTTLERFEIAVAHGNHETSRYSLLEVKPETGRMHQIRKHMKHIFHPIIGDRPHGCNKQNKLFLEKWDMKRMMLHAKTLEFQHPMTGELVKVEADYSSEFERVLRIVNQG